MLQIGPGRTEERDGTDNAHDVGVRLPAVAERPVELLVLLVDVVRRLLQHVQLDARVVSLVGTDLMWQKRGGSQKILRTVEVILDG